MNFSLRLLCILLMLGSSLIISASRIMIVTALGTKSTMLMLDYLAQHLALNGHEVVHVTKEEINPNPVVNVSYLYLKPNGSWDEESVVKILFTGSKIIEYPLLLWLDYAFSIPHHCEAFYDDENNLRKKFEDSGEFDVILIDFVMQQCLYPLVHTKKAPLILIHANAIQCDIANDLSIPSPHYLRHFFTPAVKELTFYSRTAFAFIQWSLILIHNWLINPAIEAIAAKYIPNSPPIADILKNTALVMAADDKMLISPRPILPFVVDIACTTCRPPKALPKSINKMIEESGEHGFIIFAMGTFITPKSLSQEYLKAFMTAFAKLKQTVVWQFNKTVENLPQNVKRFDWLPNQDLLGHPKCRLLIYHGGMYSTFEAIYYGVPTVGLGAFTEQVSNIMFGVEKGISVQLDKLNVTTDSVYEAIVTAMEPRYKIRAKELSVAMKDQLETPLERITYWINYAVRYKGALHLHSNEKDLNFVQYFCLDIIGFIIISLIFILFILKIILKSVYKRLNKNIKYN